MVTDDLRRQKVVFAATDALAVLAAFAAALRLHDPSAQVERHLRRMAAPMDGVLLVTTVAIWFLVFYSRDLYRMRNGGWREFRAIFKACSIATLLMLFSGFVTHVRPPRITVGIAYLLSVPFVVTARVLVRAAIRRLYANSRIAIPLLIVGFNSVGKYLCDQILDEITPYEPVGFIDAAYPGTQHRGLPVLGGPNRLAELAELYSGLEVAIAMPESSSDELDRLVAICDSHRIGWWMVPPALRTTPGGLKVEMLGMVPLIGRRGTNIEGLNYVLKRSFDLVAASILLLIALPILGMAAIAIALDDGRPILFSQTRVGIHGRPFQMLKLRTMSKHGNDAAHRDYVQRWISGGAGAATGNSMFKLTNDKRITAVGRYLRRFSIDELPQLINVVRGEMSLIGPRPALPYELNHYNAWHLWRLEGPPGLTGLWQVSGRNRLSFDEMVRLDVQYLEDWSFAGDLKILARTVPVLLRGSGA